MKVKEANKPVQIIPLSINRVLLRFISRQEPLVHPETRQKPPNRPIFRLNSRIDGKYRLLYTIKPIENYYRTFGGIIQYQCRLYNTLSEPA